MDIIVVFVSGRELPDYKAYQPGNEPQLSSRPREPVGMALRDVTTDGLVRCIIFI
jgi:hypothetical protein